MHKTIKTMNFLTTEKLTSFINSSSIERREGVCNLLLYSVTYSCELLRYLCRVKGERQNRLAKNESCFSWPDTKKWIFLI